MNTIILFPAMSNQQGRLGPLNLVWQPVKEKENSEFKPVKLHLIVTLCCIRLMQFLSEKLISSINIKYIAYNSKVRSKNPSQTLYIHFIFFDNVIFYLSLFKIRF